MSESGRVETFSDGVFAIAITLLVLEVKVPSHAGAGLWQELGHPWPSYVAYVVSFLVIGIMWVNHHTVFSYIARVDRTLVFLNLLLLMVVAAIPWPTALVAGYLGQANAAHVAVAIYSGFLVVFWLIVTAFWWYATRSGHLLHERVDRRAARATRWRFTLGVLVYPITVALAFVSAPLTLAMHAALAVYYAFNQVAIATTDAPEHAAAAKP